MLTEAIENLLNRNLGNSPQARADCVALKGRRLKIIVSGLSLAVGCESVGDSLRLTRAAEGEFHAEVEGSPVNLLALAGADPGRVLKSGAVRVRGEIELLQRYRDLMLRLQPDLEEELARLIGDASAHRLAGLAQTVIAFGRRSTDTAVRNAAEFFAHETGDLVPRAEGEAFFSEVDRLREDVDRAAARIEAMLARLAMQDASAPPAAPTDDAVTTKTT